MNHKISLCYTRFLFPNFELIEWDSLYTPPLNKSIKIEEDVWEIELVQDYIRNDGTLIRFVHLKEPNNENPN